MTVDGLLSTLRDVEGVMGSFVVDPNGQVCARDMPAMFDDVALGEAAPRLIRLRQALETEGEELNDATMEFGAHLLFLFGVDAYLLCVLCPSEVQLPALRMGAKLVSRRLHGELQREALPPTLPPPPSTAAMSSAPPPPAASPKGTKGAAPKAKPKRARFFRGRRISDDS